MTTPVRTPVLGSFSFEALRIKHGRTLLKGSGAKQAHLRSLREVDSAGGPQSSGTKTIALSQEPSSGCSVCTLSNHGRTTTGKHHEEDSISDGRCSRIQCSLLRRRTGENCWSSAAIRRFLVLPGSRYRHDEMSGCQHPARRRWQHEGDRCGSSDTRISRNGFGG
jgi:hypothetical protein